VINKNYKHATKEGQQLFLCGFFACNDSIFGLRDDEILVVAAATMTENEDDFFG